MTEEQIARFQSIHAEYQRIKGAPDLFTKIYARVLVQEMEAIADAVKAQHQTRWQRFTAWLRTVGSRMTITRRAADVALVVLLLVVAIVVFYGVASWLPMRG